MSARTISRVFMSPQLWIMHHLIGCTPNALRDKPVKSSEARSFDVRNFIRQWPTFRIYNTRYGPMQFYIKRRKTFSTCAYYETAEDEVH